MSILDNAKTLYDQFHARMYRRFILGDQTELTLPSTHWSYAFAPSEASGDKDVFTKCNDIDPSNDKITIILKNGQQHAVLWSSEADKIKQGVRWGIVKAESITGQVIATVGRYRMMVHEERIAKGRKSNTQEWKMELLDIYQDRFEILQMLESLVNSNSDIDEFELVIENYKKKLEDLRDGTDKKEGIQLRFSQLHLEKINYEDLPDKIINDINEDIGWADAYLRKLKLKHKQSPKESLLAAMSARGHESILFFVKQQMDKNLEEFSGCNQDVVFSGAALSPGELNDYIVDARKVIDDHKPDLCDAVTAEHHGDFSVKANATEKKRVTYDFSLYGLNQEQERQALLAISFIEGWDSVDYKNDTGPVVKNNRQGGSAPLTTIRATKWNNHRNVLQFMWEYVKTWFMGIFKSTRPWEEGVNDDGFVLYATTLRKYARPNDPLIMKLWYALERLYMSIRNIFTGIIHFGVELFSSLPEEILSDWYSCKKLPELSEVLREVEAEIKMIKKAEDETLNLVISADKRKEIEEKLKNITSVLAHPDFPLDSTEYRDPVNAFFYTLAIFSDHFTHDMYAKNSTPSLVFTASFVIAGFTLLFPLVSHTVFISGYTNLLSGFAPWVGSSVYTQAFCVALMQAEIGYFVGDAIVNGPKSILAKLGEKVLDDPMPAIIFFAAAYALGYGFVNMPIPGFQEFIQTELGTSTILNDPVIGIKLFIFFDVLAQSDESHDYFPVEMRDKVKEIKNKVDELLLQKPDLKKECDSLRQRLTLLRKLNKYPSMLPKLSIETRSNLSRLVDKVFKSEPEHAESLNKLIYPEKARSTIYQLFAIPGGYVMSLIRLAFAMVSGVVALVSRQPHKAAPIKRAGKKLLKRIGKDLSRLFVASATLSSIIIKLAMSVPIALLDTFIMLIGRFAIVGLHSGHAMRKGVAAIRAGYRYLVELFYPARAMRSVSTAHPAHTVNQVMGSCTRMMRGLELKSHEKKLSINELNEFDEKRLDDKRNDNIVHENVFLSSSEEDSNLEKDLSLEESSEVYKLGYIKV